MLGDDGVQPQALSARQFQKGFEQDSRALVRQTRKAIAPRTCPEALPFPLPVVVAHVSWLACRERNERGERVKGRKSSIQVRLFFMYFHVAAWYFCLLGAGSCFRGKEIAGDKKEIDKKERMQCSCGSQDWFLSAAVPLKTLCGNVGERSFTEKEAEQGWKGDVAGRRTERKKRLSRDIRSLGTFLHA